MSRGSFRGRGRAGGGKRGRPVPADAAAGGGGFDGDDGASNGLLRQREAYMRMNFLFQAAQLTATGPAACLPLSRFYVATMRKIGTRLVIRSSPALKSDACKRCHSLLHPTPAPAAALDGPSGALLDVRQMGSSVSLQQSSPCAEPALIRTCRCCGTRRRVGLKRNRSQRAAEAEAAAAEAQGSQQQLHSQQMTSASSTSTAAEHRADVNPDADAMR